MFNILYNNLDKKVIDIVKYIGDLRDNKVKLNSLIREELNIEDLDEVDLIMTLEKEFDILITDDDYRNVNTIKDLINLIKEKI